MKKDQFPKQWIPVLVIMGLILTAGASGVCGLYFYFLAHILCPKMAIEISQYSALGFFVIMGVAVLCACLPTKYGMKAERKEAKRQRKLIIANAK